MARRKSEFPKWKGYASIKKESIETMKNMCLDDIDEMAMTLEKALMREEYFHKMLCYIQDRLEAHIFDGEDLGLCLNSAKELFGIMIVPCEGEDEVDVGDVRN